jgi:hypothetical protein
MRNLLTAALLVALGGCAATDLRRATACTEDEGFRRGAQGYAYLGECPKEREQAYFAALKRGRVWRWDTPALWGTYEAIEQTEAALLAAASDAERARLRERLDTLEWLAFHIFYSKGTYNNM